MIVRNPAHRTWTLTKFLRVQLYTPSFDVVFLKRDLDFHLGLDTAFRVNVDWRSGFAIQAGFTLAGFGFALSYVNDTKGTTT